VPGVAGLGCQTETRCCSLPPCLCGQYVSCIEESCLTATCEICPEGLFCDCSAACAPIGSSGWDYIQVCPRGHYCPYYSGAPTPCPAGTHLDKTGGIRLEECTECGFMLSSGEGAATCSLGTVSILIIVAAVSGCCLCSLGSVWLYRRRQAKRLQELAEFEFEMRHNGMKLARDMEMSEYGNGNGHHQNGNGFSSSRALVSSEEDDYSMSAESDFYQPSEFSSEANGGQAKRMTAAEKQAALAQRMQASPNPWTRSLVPKEYCIQGFKLRPRYRVWVPGRKLPIASSSSRSLRVLPLRPGGPSWELLVVSLFKCKARDLYNATADPQSYVLHARAQSTQLLILAPQILNTTVPNPLT